MKARDGQGSRSRSTVSREYVLIHRAHIFLHLIICIGSLWQVLQAVIDDGFHLGRNLGTFAPLGDAQLFSF